MNTQGHGAAIISALEAAWADIRRNHPDVPEVVLITGTGRRDRGMFHNGHFGAARWRMREGEPVPEVFLAGELFDGAHLDEEGVTYGRKALKTLLHEAAHAVAHVRGVKDTTRGGRYHNKRFVAIAEELGLTAPEASHPSIGWSMVTLEDDGAAQWSETIEALTRAALPHLGAPLLAEVAPKGRSGTRTSVECQCEEPRKLSITPKQVEAGPIICGVCREEFEEV